MGHWFLDRELLQGFGILDMNCIRAADRAVSLPPPSKLGGSSASVLPPTDDFGEEAPERLNICTETLRQLVAHQSHKHGYRHPPCIVTVTSTCVWCQNIYRDRRATYLHHQQSWKRGFCTGRSSHLHTVVAPANTTCSHCDRQFDSVAMLLGHLRSLFPLSQRTAELGPDAVGGNTGDKVEANETQSWPTGNRIRTHRSRCC